MSKPRIFEQFISSTEKNTNNVSIGNATIEANGQITSSNLKLTSASNGTGNIAIIGSDGQIYYRTPAELLNDISAAAKSTVESLSSDVSSAKSSINNLNTTINNLPKNIFYVGKTAPTDKKLLWIDTTSNSGLKYYNGSAWVTMPVCWGD